MQLHGMDHGFRKQAPKKRHHTVLVHIVHTVQAGCVAEIVQEVPQVMQKSGRDQLFAGTLLLTQMTGLQGMLQLGHWLTGVLLVAFFFKQFFYIV
jgi:hypothetical protein